MIFMKNVFKTRYIKKNVFLDVGISNYFTIRSLNIIHKSSSHPRCFASQNIFDAKLLIYLLYKYASKMSRFSEPQEAEKILLELVIKSKLLINVILIILINLKNIKLHVFSL